MQKSYHGTAIFAIVLIQIKIYFEPHRKCNNTKKFTKEEKSLVSDYGLLRFFWYGTRDVVY